MSFIYDFEKPAEQFRQQLAALKQDPENNASQIRSMRRKLDKIEEIIHSNLTPWQRIQLSRHPERPYTLDYVENCCSDFLELSGDRRSSDDKAIVGGPAIFRGRKIMVIGTQKGRDTKSNVYRNFGWPQPEGYRKALRLMRLANQAGIPIVSFIDTPGAYPGVGSEERHIAEAIAVNLREMFNFSVPMIACIIGEGGSGGAIGLGVANRVLVMENSYYSVITPEGCAAILWKDRAFAPQAAEALQITAEKLLEFKIADEIVAEPPGGAHCDYEVAAKLLGDAIERHLKQLTAIPAEQLTQQRYDKFRQYGAFAQETTLLKQQPDC